MSTFFCYKKYFCMKAKYSKTFIFFILTFTYINSNLFAQETKKFEGFFVYYKYRKIFSDDNFKTKDLLFFLGTDDKKKATMVFNSFICDQKMLLKLIDSLPKFYFDWGARASLANSDYKSQNILIKNANKSIDFINNIITGDSPITEFYTYSYNKETQNHFYVEFRLYEFKIDAIEITLKNLEGYCRLFKIEDGLVVAEDEIPELKGFIPVKVE